MMSREHHRRRSPESSRRRRRERRDSREQLQNQQVLPNIPPEPYQDPYQQSYQQTFQEPYHQTYQMPYQQQPEPSLARDRAYSSASSSSSTSSSLLNISRPSKRFALGTFFSGSDRKHRRRVKKRRSRFLRFGNSSSSSVGSDLAYGRGYIDRRRSREFSPSSGARPPRSGGEAERPTPLKRAQTDEEIIELGRKFAEIARQQNAEDLRASGKVRPSTIAGAAAAISQFRRSKSGHQGRGIGSSKLDGHSSPDDSEWESASSDGESSDGEFDHGLAYGSNHHLPSNPGTLPHSGEAQGHANEIPSNRNPSMIDPRHFGPVNSLRGFVTPLSFDRADPSNITGHEPQRYDPLGHSDQIVSSEGRSMQQVHPVPIPVPAPYDAGRGSVISTRPDPTSRFRPEPVPIQQPKPIAPVSKKVFESVGDEPRYSRKSSASDALVKTAGIGLAGAAIGAAVSSDHAIGAILNSSHRDESDKDAKRRSRRLEDERSGGRDKHSNRDEGRLDKERARDDEKEKRRRERRDYEIDVDAEKAKRRRDRRRENEDQSVWEEDQKISGKGSRKDRRREDSSISYTAVEKSEGDLSRKEVIDPFQYQVSDSAFTTPKYATPVRPLTPMVVTVEREPDFSSFQPTERLSRKDSFEQEFQDAKKAYEHADTATVPVNKSAITAAAAVVAAAAAGGGSSGKHHDRSSEPVRDSIQDDADRAYREYKLARKIQEDDARSRSNSPDRSVVDNWKDKGDTAVTTQIVTPPALDQTKKKSPYDGPDADVRIDHILEHPRELSRFQASGSRSRGRSATVPSFIARDPSAERDRPVLNIVRPTPSPSPAPERRREASIPPRPQSKDTEAFSSTPVQNSTASRGDNSSAPSTPTSKGVTWGENQTKHYIVESPDREDDPYSGTKIITPAETHRPRSSKKSSGWGIIAAAVTGAGVAAAASSISDSDVKADAPRETAESKDREKKGSSSQFDTTYDNPPIPGPKPPSPRSSQMPGGFAEDPTFTANIAAGLEGSGFDPNIVIDDATFHRRDSPPGSNEDEQELIAERSDTFSRLGKKERRQKEKDNASNFADLTAFTDMPQSSTQDSWDIPTAKLSKKEQKRREEAMKEQAALEIEQKPDSSTLTREPQPEPEPPVDEWEDMSSKKKKSKKSKKAIVIQESVERHGDDEISRAPDVVEAFKNSVDDKAFIPGNDWDKVVEPEDESTTVVEAEDDWTASNRDSKDIDWDSTPHENDQRSRTNIDDSNVPPTEEFSISSKSKKKKKKSKRESGVDDFETSTPPASELSRESSYKIVEPEVDTTTFDEWDLPKDKKIKSSKRDSGTNDFESTPAPVSSELSLESSYQPVEPEIEPTPAEEWDLSRKDKKKKKKKRDSTVTDIIERSTDEKVDNELCDPATGDNGWDDWNQPKMYREVDAIPSQELIVESPKGMNDSFGDLRSEKPFATEDDWDAPKKSKKKKSKRDSTVYDDNTPASPSLFAAPSETSVGTSRRKSKADSLMASPTSEKGKDSIEKKSKKDKQRSAPGGFPDDDDLDRGEPPDRGRDRYKFEDNDISSVVSDSHHYDRHRSRHSRTGTEDFDDAKSVASAPDGAKRKGSKSSKEKRSSGTSSFFDRFKSSIGIAEDKDKNSFLDNAGTLGASVGLTGAAIAVALDETRETATNTLSEKDLQPETTASEIHRSSSPKTEPIDPEIVEREIRPAIDPQYGDLLPLPPSRSASPVPNISDDIPPLPESRPGTPEDDRERYLLSNKPTHVRRRSDTPLRVKTPSQSAIPIQFRLGQRNLPLSPSLRPSPLASPVVGNAETGSASKSRARPTSWESSRSFKPLLLVARTSRESIETPSQLQDEIPSSAFSDEFLQDELEPPESVISQDVLQDADVTPVAPTKEKAYQEESLDERLTQEVDEQLPGSALFPPTESTDDFQNSKPDPVDPVSKNRSSYLYSSPIPSQKFADPDSITEVGQNPEISDQSLVDDISTAVAVAGVAVGTIAAATVADHHNEADTGTQPVDAGAHADEVDEASSIWGKKAKKGKKGKKSRDIQSVVEESSNVAPPTEDQDFGNRSIFDPGLNSQDESDLTTTRNSEKDKNNKVANRESDIEPVNRVEPPLPISLDADEPEDEFFDAPDELAAEPDTPAIDHMARETSVVTPVDSFVDASTSAPPKEPIFQEPTSSSKKAKKKKRKSHIRDTTTDDQSSLFDPNDDLPKSILPNAEEDSLAALLAADLIADDFTPKEPDEPTHKQPDVADSIQVGPLVEELVPEEARQTLDAPSAQVEPSMSLSKKGKKKKGKKVLPWEGELTSTPDTPETLSAPLEDQLPLSDTLDVTQDVTELSKCETAEQTSPPAQLTAEDQRPILDSKEVPVDTITNLAIAQEWPIVTPKKSKKKKKGKSAQSLDTVPVVEAEAEAEAVSYTDFTPRVDEPVLESQASAQDETPMKQIAANIDLGDTQHDAQPTHGSPRELAESSNAPSNTDVVTAPEDVLPASIVGQVESLLEEDTPDTQDQTDSEINKEQEVQDDQKHALSDVDESFPQAPGGEENSKDPARSSDPLSENTLGSELIEAVPTSNNSNLDTGVQKTDTLSSELIGNDLESTMDWQEESGSKKKGKKNKKKKQQQDAADFPEVPEPLTVATEPNIVVVEESEEMASADKSAMDFGTRAAEDPLSETLVSNKKAKKGKKAKKNIEEAANSTVDGDRPLAGSEEPAADHQETINPDQSIDIPQLDLLADDMWSEPTAPGEKGKKKGKKIPQSQEWTTEGVDHSIAEERSASSETNVENQEQEHVLDSIISAEPDTIVMEGEAAVPEVGLEIFPTKKSKKDKKKKRASSHSNLFDDEVTEGVSKTEQVEDSVSAQLPDQSETSIEASIGVKAVDPQQKDPEIPDEANFETPDVVNIPANTKKSKKDKRKRQSVQFADPIEETREISTEKPGQATAGEAAELDDQRSEEMQDGSHEGQPSGSTSDIVDENLGDSTPSSESVAVPLNTTSDENDNVSQPPIDLHDDPHQSTTGDIQDEAAASISAPESLDSLLQDVQTPPEAVLATEEDFPLPAKKSKKDKKKRKDKAQDDQELISSQTIAVNNAELDDSVLPGTADTAAFDKEALKAEQEKAEASNALQMEEPIEKLVLDEAFSDAPQSKKAKKEKKKKKRNSLALDDEPPVLPSEELNVDLTDPERKEDSLRPIDDQIQLNEEGAKIDTTPTLTRSESVDFTTQVDSSAPSESLEEVKEDTWAEAEGAVEGEDPLLAAEIAAEEEELAALNRKKKLNKKDKIRLKDLNANANRRADKAAARTLIRASNDDISSQVDEPNAPLAFEPIAETSPPEEPNFEDLSTEKALVEADLPEDSAVPSEDLPIDALLHESLPEELPADTMPSSKSKKDKKKKKRGNRLSTEEFPPQEELGITSDTPISVSEAGNAEPLPAAVDDSMTAVQHIGVEGGVEEDDAFESSRSITQDLSSQAQKANVVNLEEPVSMVDDSKLALDQIAVADVAEEPSSGTSQPSSAKKTKKDKKEKNQADAWDDESAADSNEPAQQTAETSIPALADDEASPNPLVQDEQIKVNNLAEFAPTKESKKDKKKKKSFSWGDDVPAEDHPDTQTATIGESEDAVPSTDAPLEVSPNAVVTDEDHPMEYLALTEKSKKDKKEKNSFSWDGETPAEDQQNPHTADTVNSEHVDPIITEPTESPPYTTDISEPVESTATEPTETNPATMVASEPLGPIATEPAESLPVTTAVVGHELENDITSWDDQSTEVQPIVEFTPTKKSKKDKKKKKAISWDNDVQGDDEQLPQTATAVASEIVEPIADEPRESPADTVAGVDVAFNDENTPQDDQSVETQQSGFSPSKKSKKDKKNKALALDDAVTQAEGAENFVGGVDESTSIVTVPLGLVEATGAGENTELERSTQPLYPAEAPQPVEQDRPGEAAGNIAPIEDINTSEPAKLAEPVTHASNDEALADLISPKKIKKDKKKKKQANTWGDDLPQELSVEAAPETATATLIEPETNVQNVDEAGDATQSAEFTESTTSRKGKKDKKKRKQVSLWVGELPDTEHQEADVTHVPELPEPEVREADPLEATHALTDSTSTKKSKKDKKKKKTSISWEEEERVSQASPAEDSIGIATFNPAEQLAANIAQAETSKVDESLSDFAAFKGSKKDNEKKKEVTSWEDDVSREDPVENLGDLAAVESAKTREHETLASDFEPPTADETPIDAAPAKKSKKDKKKKKEQSLVENDDVLENARREEPLEEQQLLDPEKENLASEGILQEQPSFEAPVDDNAVPDLRPEITSQDQLLDNEEPSQNFSIPLGTNDVANDEEKWSKSSQDVDLEAFAPVNKSKKDKKKKKKQQQTEAKAFEVESQEAAMRADGQVEEAAVIPEPDTTIYPEAPRSAVATEQDSADFVPTKKSKKDKKKKRVSILDAGPTPEMPAADELELAAEPLEAVIPTDQARLDAKTEEAPANATESISLPLDENAWQEQDVLISRSLEDQTENSKSELNPSIDVSGLQTEAIITPEPEVENSNVIQEPEPSESTGQELDVVSIPAELEPETVKPEETEFKVDQEEADFISRKKSKKDKKKKKRASQVSWETEPEAEIGSQVEQEQLETTDTRNIDEDVGGQATTSDQTDVVNDAEATEDPFADFASGKKKSKKQRKRQSQIDWESERNEISTQEQKPLPSPEPEHLPGETLDHQSLAEDNETSLKDSTNLDDVFNEDTSNEKSKKKKEASQVDGEDRSSPVVSSDIPTEDPSDVQDIPENIWVSPGQPAEAEMEQDSNPLPETASTKNTKEEKRKDKKQGALENLDSEFVSGQPPEGEIITNNALPSQTEDPAVYAEPTLRAPDIPTSSSKDFWAEHGAGDENTVTNISTTRPENPETLIISQLDSPSQPENDKAIDTIAGVDQADLQAPIVEKLHETFDDMQPKQVDETPVQSVDEFAGFSTKKSKKEKKKAEKARALDLTSKELPAAASSATLQSWDWSSIDNQPKPEAATAGDIAYFEEPPRDLPVKQDEAGEESIVISEETGRDLTDTEKTTIVEPELESEEFLISREESKKDKKRKGPIQPDSGSTSGTQTPMTQDVAESILLEPAPTVEQARQSVAEQLEDDEWASSTKKKSKKDKKRRKTLSLVDEIPQESTLIREHQVTQEPVLEDFPNIESKPALNSWEGERLLPSQDLVSVMHLTQEDSLRDFPEVDPSKEVVSGPWSPSPTGQFPTSIDLSPAQLSSHIEHDRPFDQSTQPEKKVRSLAAGETTILDPPSPRAERLNDSDRPSTHESFASKEDSKKERNTKVSADSDVSSEAAAIATAAAAIRVVQIGEKVGSSKKGKGKKKSKYVDKRTPTEADIFDDPALWESSERKPLEEGSRLDADSADFWNGPSTESEDWETHAEDKPLSVADEVDVESPIVGREATYNLPPLHNSEQSSAEIKEANEADMLSSWDDLDTSEQLEEGTRGLEEATQTGSTITSLPMPPTSSAVDYGRVSPQGLPPVEEETREDLEMEFQSRDLEKKPPTLEANRDSGFVTDSPNPQQHSFLTAQRDSGVHLRDWPEAEERSSESRSRTPRARRSILDNEMPKLSTPTRDIASEKQGEEEEPVKRTTTPLIKRRTGKYQELESLGNLRTPLREGHRSVSDTVIHQEQEPSQARRSTSNTSLSRLRTPEPHEYRTKSPGSHSLRSSGTNTPPLRRVDRRVSGDLRSLSQHSSTSHSNSSHPTEKKDPPPEAAAASTTSSTADRRPLQNTTPIANEGRVRAKDMSDVY
ncbi:hypothetical protein F5Y16DRAFT_355605, partial [Xylariaceae sp. FL0255]